MTLIMEVKECNHEYFKALKKQIEILKDRKASGAQGLEE